MEAAAQYGKTMLVTDRPISSPHVVDGPLLDPGFKSFVAAIPTPFAYAMTPGETALWIQDQRKPALDLRVIGMKGYQRETERQPDRSTWVPPFTRYSFLGKRPVLSHNRFHGSAAGPGLRALGCPAPFQVLGASWLDAVAVCDALRAVGLPGLGVASTEYERFNPSGEKQRLPGIRFHTTGPKDLPSS